MPVDAFVYQQDGTDESGRPYKAGDLTYASWWFLHSLRNSASIAVDASFITVNQFGAIGNGVHDDASAINAAIAAVVAAGGGGLQFLNGTYLVGSPIIFPAGLNNLTILGNGATILRGANMPADQGVLDLQGSWQVKFQNLAIDGDTTVATGITYAAFGYDPCYAPFLLNTSIWLHPGCEDIEFDNITITHTGGYAIFSDTRGGTVNNRRIHVTRSNFINNRPFLFGTNPADLNYGSWVGGIFYKGDCSSASYTGVTIDMSVTDCAFERNTGNCIWGHCAGFANYHRNIRMIGNGFLDCGLDAIEPACTVGGCVIGNVGQRIGYICTDDTSRSTPRYLAGVNATFLDSSGYVESVPFTGNSCSSICGGYVALDGYCYGSVTGNDFRQPQPGEVLYVDDQIALVPAGVVYGINCNNSQNNDGGDGLDISGNTLYGCTAASMILIDVRNSKIAANNIWQPGNSTFEPVLIGNTGAGPNQRAYGNSITGNRIYWSPATPLAAINENTNWSGVAIPWAAGDANWCEGNHIFDPTGNAFEFGKAPSTSSITSVRVSTAVASPTADGHIDIRRMTAANGTAGFTALTNKSGVDLYRLYDADDTLSLTTTAVFGLRAVRFRQTAGDHAQAGSIQYRGATVAGALAIFGAGTTAANRLIELRDLVTIGGTAGSTSLAVTAGNVAFGTTFLWNNTTSILTITGVAGTGVIAQLFNSSATGSDTAFQSANCYIYANGHITLASANNATVSLEVTTGYISAAGGFNSTFNSTATVNIPNGGVTAKWLVATDSLFFIEEAAPAVSSGGQSRIYMDSTTHVLMVSENGAAYVALVGSSTPGGADTEVQFNNTGALDGTPDLTFNSGIGLLYAKYIETLAIKFDTNSTAAGVALLGANCPAITVGAPYTWITANSSDGSLVYIPCWK